MEGLDQGDLEVEAGRLWQGVGLSVNLGPRGQPESGAAPTQTPISESSPRHPVPPAWNTRLPEGTLPLATASRGPLLPWGVGKPYPDPWASTILPRNALESLQLQSPPSENPTSSPGTGLEGAQASWGLG